jgi:hypothetical protein
VAAILVSGCGGVNGVEESIEDDAHH